MAVPGRFGVPRARAEARRLPQGFSETCARIEAPFGPRRTGLAPVAEHGIQRGLKHQLPKKIRVYELARELGLTNKEALDLCISLGIGVKNHSSSIEDAQGDRVRRKADREGLRREVSPPEPEPVKKAAKKAAAPVSAPAPTPAPAPAPEPAL